MGLTTLAALIILVLYFGLTQFRPALGMITIIPIAVVVIWVLAPCGRWGSPTTWRPL